MISILYPVLFFVKTLTFEYCKFGNFQEGFIFTKSLEKINSSRNDEITLSFVDIA